MLSTSLGPLDVALGEIGWAMLRGAAWRHRLHRCRGAVRPHHPWWALLMIPAPSSWRLLRLDRHDAHVVHEVVPSLNWLNWLLPLFCSAPSTRSRCSTGLQAIIMVTPLWQAIAMMRSLAFGVFDGARRPWPTWSCSRPSALSSRPAASRRSVTAVSGGLEPAWLLTVSCRLPDRLKASTRSTACVECAIVRHGGDPRRAPVSAGRHRRG